MQSVALAVKRHDGLLDIMLRSKSISLCENVKGMSR